MKIINTKNRIIQYSQKENDDVFTLDQTNITQEIPEDTNQEVVNDEQTNLAPEVPKTEENQQIDSDEYEYSINYLDKNTLVTLERLAIQVKSLGDELYRYMKTAAELQKEPDKKQKFRILARDFHVYTTLLYRELVILSKQTEESINKLFNQKELNRIRESRKKKRPIKRRSPYLRSSEGPLSNLPPEQFSFFQQYNTYGNKRYSDKPTMLRINKTERLLNSMNLGRMINSEDILRLTKGRFHKLSAMDRQQAAFWLPFFLVPEIMNKYDLLTRRVVLEYIPKNYGTLVEGKKPQGHFSPLYWAAIGEVEKAPNHFHSSYFPQKRLFRQDTEYLTWENAYKEINRNLEIARKIINIDKFNRRFERQKGFPKQLKRIVNQFDIMKYSYVDKALVMNILNDFMDSFNKTF